MIKVYEIYFLWADFHKMIQKIYPIGYVFAFLYKILFSKGTPFYTWITDHTYFLKMFTIINYKEDENHSIPNIQC